MKLKRLRQRQRQQREIMAMENNLIEKLGGIGICKKITFQKRLRKPNATHFIQHPGNPKLIQMFSKVSESKHQACVFDVPVYRFDELERALGEVQS